MRFDHLAYAAGPEGLGSCAQRLGAALGAGFRDGGIHPRFGTRNFVLSLADNYYVEVVQALDHPAVDQQPFGRAVRERGEQGGGWLGWVVAVDDLAPFEQRLGRGSAPGQRRRPDGVVLEWRQLGVLDLALEPWLPYFVEWLTPPTLHPSAERSSIALEAVEIGGDPRVVSDYLGLDVTDAFDGVRIEWSDPDEGAGVQAARFRTPQGTVRID